jgi:Ca-activated chloride channel homolog
MTFSTPLALWLLLLVPILLAAYLLLMRRKRKNAVSFSNVALIRMALPKRANWKRHIPVALLLASIAGLSIASARPQMSVTVPLSRTSIILALDVSRSMCATDVEPNRLAVAQEAARNFVKEQVSGTRIGLVAFAGFAELVVPPTTNKDDLIGVIDKLTTARGTVIGAATLKAIDAIAAMNPDVAPVGSDVGTETGSSDTPAPPPPGDGGYVPDIIVLLTDGANTRGIDPVEAAKEAAARRIRVYTIGFGTTNPTAMVCTQQQLGADVFNDGGFPGGGGGPPPGVGGRDGRGFLVIDEPTLQAVADITGGAFYKAEDANQLRSVFNNLPRQVVLQHQKHEVTVIFAIAGALLAMAAFGLSLLWNRSL